MGGDAREAIETPLPVEPVHVGTGELRIAQAPDVLVALALGSCVGVAIWDPVHRAGGLAHVMLPSPADSRSSVSLDRFATHAIPYVVERLAALGARHRLVARIAGGAAMFAGDSAVASIGDRNVAETRRQLVLAQVPVIAEDTGGSHARTMEFYLETGRVLVRSYRYGIKEL